MANKTARAVAIWFGCGLSPKAPGTVGSAAGAAIAIALHHYAGFAGWHYAALAAAAFLPAVWAADVTAREMQIEDPQIVVVDEVVGQWIAFAGASVLTPATYVAAFALFRVFDIWKPFPVRQCERLPGGWGIITDDVMAGIYAALVLFLAGCFNLY